MASEPGYENLLYKVKPELYNDENFMQMLNRVRSGSFSIKDVPLVWRITMQADSQYQERIAKRARQSDLTLEEVRLLSVMSKIGAPISDELRKKLDRRKLGEKVQETFGPHFTAGTNARWVKDAVEAAGDREVIVAPGVGFQVPKVPEVLEEPIPDEVLTPEEEVIVESIVKGLGPDYVAQRSISGKLPVDTKSKSKYTRGEALRITNQMAANRDPNWKAFWKEQEKLGFRPDSEDPNLAESAKKVWSWITKDRPKEDRKPTTRRRGSPRKKGGVVNKRVTKQYAKGGSVRTPKRVK